MFLLTGSILLDILTISVGLTALAVAYMKWSFGFWKRRGVYTLPPSIPFGNGLDLILQKKNLGVELGDVYHKLKEKGVKYGGYYFCAKPIFVPVDLDLVKLMMTRDFAHFPNHVVHVNEEIEPLTGHLFSLKDQKWKNLRQRLTPTFSSGKMKMMYPAVVDCAKHMEVVVGELSDQGEAIEMKEIVARYMTDIIGSCAFGIECGCLKNPNSEFIEYGKKVFDPSFTSTLVRLISLTIPGFLDYVHLKRFRKDVTNFFMNVVKDTVDYREQNNIVRKDFMHLLIQLKNNVNIKENDVGEMAAQCLVFFVAGHETSATTLTFCLYELSMNQEIQEKAREEVNAILEKYEGELTYEAITEMTYMEKCISETLRKYPPAPVHTRECTETYRIPDSDLVLEKGSFVFIPIMGIQYDPEYYPEPEKFDPERFSEENKAKRHPSAWTPFGDGPRLCIGIRFSSMQTKVGLALLLKNFKFTLSPKTLNPLYMDPANVILTVKSGVWLNVERC